VSAKPPADGDVLVLAEADYLYGAGRLILRVEQIDRASPITYGSEVWYLVRGTQISWHGDDICSREVFVRGPRLFA
jgi:hypothetical protein